ncbi:hypothetical protein SCA6_012592 [Theobroma cacao]
MVSTLDNAFILHEMSLRQKFYSVIKEQCIFLGLGYTTLSNFDESDCDEEIETEDASGSIKRPPERSPPPVPSSYDKQDSIHRVHPKLPDYDDLAARFEALKFYSVIKEQYGTVSLTF